MSHVQYPDHVMFCNSTGNQSINLIPAMQFGLEEAVLLSTSTATKWTERLVDVMKKYKIKTKVVSIDASEEKGPNIFVEKVLKVADEYNLVLWNISGGQKIPTVALYNCFTSRLQNNYSDYLCYVEGSDPAIWLYDKDLKSEKIRSDVALTLEDLLHLSGSKICSSVKLYPAPNAETASKLEIGSKALEYYRSNDLFREAFFAMMSQGEIMDCKEEIRKTLNSLMPKIDELKISKTGYEDFQVSINQLIKAVQNAKSFNDIKPAIKKLSLISNPHDIYKEYWDAIKRACINETIKRLNTYNQPLFNRGISKKDEADFISAIQTIGGSVKDPKGALYKSNLTFSAIGKNSELFEWMVAAAVLEAINKDPNIADSISEVHCNVKTQLLENDCAKNDAEIDVLITTKFGTFIVLEAKTYDFTGDTAKSKESIAYKKSGPFAKAIIVGPLLKTMVRIKDDKSKEFPPYIQGKTKDQEETARQHGILYWYLDEIELNLKKQLSIL